VPIGTGACGLHAAGFPDVARIYEKPGSMTRTLARLGFADYQRRTTRITASFADAIDAAHLELMPGRPVLVVGSVNVLPDGSPILVNRVRFAADRVELVVDV